MARYRNSQDLGVFIGAKYITCPNEEGKPVRGIFIPDAINGIVVTQDKRGEDKRNASGIRAFINTQQCFFKNNRYIDSVKERLVKSGEQVTAYNVPAYQICYTLPEEKRNKIRAALAVKILKQHPEWAGQTDTQGTDLARAISMMMPFQMGDSYLIEDQNTQQQLNSTAPVAQQVAGYTPQAVDMNDPNAWAPSTDDDLPF